MSVKIKSLVWEEPEFLGANPSYAPHTSSTTMGLYFANEHAFWYEGGPANSADNLEAAKSAAQRDYEARIRSVLEPDPLADARVAALVETAQWARNRLETIADENWRGDARDFKRSLVGVFADFDAALAAFHKGGKDE